MLLDEFEVSLSPGVSPALLTNHNEPSQAVLWSFKDLDVGSNLAVLLAVNGYD